MGNHDILYHYVYIMEYCWNLLPISTNRMTNILDLQGLSFGFNILFKEKQMIKLIKNIVTLMSEHYPSRSYKTFIIHAPSWFQLMYRLIKPLLRDSTKSKIEIFSSSNTKHAIAVLKNTLGHDDITLYYDLLDHQDKNEQLLFNHHDNNDFFNSIGMQSYLEKQLRSFCLLHIEKAGLQMEKVLI